MKGMHGSMLRTWSELGLACVYVGTLDGLCLPDLRIPCSQIFPSQSALQDGKICVYRLQRAGRPGANHRLSAIRHGPYSKCIQVW